MSAYISFKKSIIFLLLGIICAAGTAFLINFLLSGPKLGRVYDFLLNRRPSPPVSNEIIIINTSEFVESSDIYSVLMTLTEMEAVELIMTARISGSSPVIGTEAEIRSFFYDEYALTGNNIRNLFQAIRSGSVPPSDAPLFVERLVELSEQSRDRLLSALIDRDENLILSAAVFGNYTEVNIKPEIDWDGKIRRVRPVETESSAEHPVYRSLKYRYAVSKIENTPQGRIMLLRKFNGSELVISLDIDGNVLTPGKGSGFRGIDVSIFREYEEVGRVMRRVLKEADEIGAFSQTLPENSPLYLDEYAAVLREEMLKSPQRENRLAWIASRVNYFESLDKFLYGPAEMTIVSGYEEVIADENALKEEGLAKLGNMRDELIRSFIAMREVHSELIALRAKLKTELDASFCIMGPQETSEYSALLANLLITGSHIRTAYNHIALFWSIAACVVILIILFRLRPAVLLFSGIGCSVLAVAVFGWNFVLTAFWIDPDIVFGSTLSGTLVIFCCKCISLSRRARRFRAAYGTAVSNSVLRELIRNGSPLPCEVSVNEAAVVVIKDVNLLGREYREKPQESGKALRSFYEKAKEIIVASGGVVAGYQGDAILACFGSPLNQTHEPVNKAYTFVKELLSDKKINWRFGVDFGKCTFSWLPEAGFTANGRPVVRAKILASRTARFKARALITGLVREKTNSRAKKIGSLYNENDFFYELTGNDFTPGL